MNSTPESGSAKYRQIYHLARLGSALCLGGMFAFIGSIESINPRVAFSLNWKVFAGLLGGGGFAWWVLGRLFRAADAEDRGESVRRGNPVFWIIAFSLLMGGLTLGGFAWAMKGTANERLRDVLFGTVMALWVLGFGGLMVGKLIRFLEADSKRAEEEFNRELERGKADESDDR